MNMVLNSFCSIVFSTFFFFTCFSLTQVSIFGFSTREHNMAPSLICQFHSIPDLSWRIPQRSASLKTFWSEKYQKEIIHPPPFLFSFYVLQLLYWFLSKKTDGCGILDKFWMNSKVIWFLRSKLLIHTSINFWIVFESTK